MGLSLKTGSPGFSVLQLVFEFPATRQRQFQVFCPYGSSSGGFCSWALALVSCDSLYPPTHLSSLQGSSLPCDPISLMDPRRVVSFQFVQFFSWEDGNDDFSDLHVSDQKMPLHTVKGSKEKLIKLLFVLIGVQKAQPETRTWCEWLM